MAAQAPQKGSGGIPPRGPMVSTQERAESLQDVGGNWIIVAVRPNGSGEWEPTMPYEQWRILKNMADDGALAMTQRRDPAGTVLLAKLRTN